jgi:hypothetical protein
MLLECLHRHLLPSDPEFFPETEEAIEKSSSSSSGDSAIFGSGYIIDSNSDSFVDSGIHAGEDDIYSLARGEIEDAPQPPSCLQWRLTATPADARRGKSGNS